MKPMLRTLLRLALVPMAVALAGTTAQAQAPAQDWPNLAAYRAANAALGAPAAGEARVVFMGDSITEFWDKPRQGFFKNPHYINRGISGQTSSQMLLRFRQDVLALSPRVVVILAGTNDIAGNTGPIAVEAIAGNIQSMVELARFHGLRVVLGAVLPAASFYWRPEILPAEDVRRLNSLLAGIAAASDARFVDYHAALADAQHGLAKLHSGDGVHPNEAGYRVMADLLEPAIRAALGADN